MQMINILLFTKNKTFAVNYIFGIITNNDDISRVLLMKSLPVWRKSLETCILQNQNMKQKLRLLQMEDKVNLGVQIKVEALHWEILLQLLKNVVKNLNKKFIQLHFDFNWVVFFLRLAIQDRPLVYDLVKFWY